VKLEADFRAVSRMGDRVAAGKRICLHGNNI